MAEGELSGHEAGRTTSDVNEIVPMSALTREAFCRFILEKTGIVILEHQMQNLHDVVSRGCARLSLSSADDYLSKLRSSYDAVSELENFIASITVGESYFFRDAAHVEFIKNVWLPDILARKSDTDNKTIRIWSAGCSNGQEIYTMAMLLGEAVGADSGWAVHLLGSDINSAALSRAFAASYEKWSMRAITQEYVERYFRVDGTRYILNDRIRAMVKFSYLNLVDDTFPSILTETNALDLIMCRNVFIYLDRPVVKRVLEKFNTALVGGGVLLVGASDLIDPEVPGMSMENYRDASYYVKPPYQAAAPKTGAVYLEPVPLPPPSDSPASRIRDAKPIIRDAKGEARGLLTRLEQDLVNMDREGRWHDIIPFADVVIAEEGESMLALNLKAKAFASVGLLAEAEKVCDRSIELFHDKHCYFLKGMVMLDLNRLTDAAACLRRVIFLDHEFLEAYMHLGMILLRSDAASAGLKCLKGALRIAEKGDPKRVLHAASDMTFERFAKVLKGEIEVYGRTDKR